MRIVQRSLRALGLLALAASLFACSSAHEPPARPRGAVSEAGLIETTTYLVREIRVPSEPWWDEELPPVVPGFDLDGFASTWTGAYRSCEDRLEDYRSSLDPEERGVDNALANLAMTLDPWVETYAGQGLDAEVQRAVAEGRLLIAIEIEGLHISEDGEVRVRVYGVEPEEGALLLERYEAEDGRERERPLPQPLRGRLLGEAVGQVEGDRVVAWFSILEMPVEGAPLPLLPLSDLRSARSALGLRFDPEGGATGVLGGSLSVEAFEANLEETGLAEGDAGILPDALRLGLADMSPSREDPELCERFSVGLGLDLVRVDTIRR